MDCVRILEYSGLCGIGVLGVLWGYWNIWGSEGVLEYWGFCRGIRILRILWGYWSIGHSEAVRRFHGCKEELAYFLPVTLIVSPSPYEKFKTQSKFKKD